MTKPQKAQQTIDTPPVRILLPKEQRAQQEVNAALLQRKPVKSWSFSRLKDYLQCPRFFAWKHLLKQGDKKSAAMDRGTEIHGSAEGFARGTTNSLLPELATVKPVLLELRKLKRVVSVEASWGFDRQWQPCSSTDWDRCWLRVKMDVHYIAPKVPDTLEMIDWKTGKPRPDEHKEQLKLYGAAGLRQVQQIAKAHGVLHYTDHGIKEELTVLRREEKPLIKYWEAQVKPLFNDTRFVPKPGPKCKYCPFSRERGGACPF